MCIPKLYGTVLCIPNLYGTILTQNYRLHIDRTIFNFRKYFGHSTSQYQNMKMTVRAAYLAPHAEQRIEKSNREQKKTRFRFTHDTFLVLSQITIDFDNITSTYMCIRFRVAKGALTCNKYAIPTTVLMFYYVNPQGLSSGY